MKTPLSYQLSEYDCGPTTMLNAISFLFDRKQIAPDLIKSVHMFCMDSFNRRGEVGKYGTSRIEISYLGDWLNEYAVCRKLPIHCQSLHQDDIFLGVHSRITACLQCGGCAIARVHYGCDHYILLTAADVQNEESFIFDPYYRDIPFHSRKITMIESAPDRYNRKISWDLLNNEGKTTYALGPVEKRECMLLYNMDTYQIDKSEYII